MVTYPRTLSRCPDRGRYDWHGRFRPAKRPTDAERNVAWVVEMMSRSGVRPSQATRMLLPLIGSTLANLTHQDPARALTGTFKRGDLATAKLHLDAIASQRLTDALRAYLILSERSLKLSDISIRKKAAIQKLLRQARP